MTARKGVIFCFLLSLLGMAWGQKEPQVHLQSIRNASYEAEGPMGAASDSAFLEYVIQFLLEEPQDVMFVSNRDLLQSLCVSFCSKQSVEIHDTLKGGRIASIEVFTTAFDSTAHDFMYFTGDDSLIKAIDGRRVFGAVDRKPLSQVDSMHIKVGKRSLKIPREAYEDLYDPNLCNAGFFQQPVGAYPSLSEDYLYVYIYGGRSSGIYFAKLIFDKKRYIKKIVAEYEDLIQYGAIREDFIGY